MQIVKAKGGGETDLKKLKRIIIIGGHYGTGKTNLAVNLALDFKKSGEAVTLCDLDIVNPYFRSSDFKVLARQRGIQLVSPIFAGTNLDLPALSSRLDAAIFDESSRLIIDVGGDDAGAAVLGRYAAKIMAAGYSFLYVINRSRPLTETPRQAVEILREIEQASRLAATDLANNTHLAQLTSAEIILNSQDYAQQVSALTGLELLFTTAPRPLADEVQAGCRQGDVYPIELYVKTPW